MSIPRLSAFGVLLLLNRRWNIAAFNMPLRDGSKAARMGFVPLALWIFFFRAGHGQSFTVAMMIIGFFTSLAAGLFEEYAFRGPLLSALSHRFSIFTAIVLSNVLFAAYHIQAQSIRFWPIVFLTGVIYANLRFRGLSIGWLALIHGITDACFFLFPSINPKPFGFYSLVLQAGLLIYAVVIFPRSGVTDSRYNKPPELN
jgi:membrane protease YdiL (CAAX protease family)